eukprot:2272815-Prymnesium_polylepis.1
MACWWAVGGLGALDGSRGARLCQKSRSVRVLRSTQCGSLLLEQHRSLVSGILASLDDAYTSLHADSAIKHKKMCVTALMTQSIQCYMYYQSRVESVVRAGAMQNCGCPRASYSPLSGPERGGSLRSRCRRSKRSASGSPLDGSSVPASASASAASESSSVILRTVRSARTARVGMAGWLWWRALEPRAAASRALRTGAWPNRRRRSRAPECHTCSGSRSRRFRGR